MSVTVRNAIREDLPAMLDIYNDAVLHTTATFDVREQTMKQREAWFQKYGGKYPLIVAEVEGHVAGYCHLSPFREKEAYARTVELSIYIANTFRGRGLGKLLLDNILTRARDLGHHAIIAGITGGNDVSVRMHKKFGFEFVGTFKEVGHKFGEWQSVHFYQLTIPVE